MKLKTFLRRALVRANLPVPSVLLDSATRPMRLLALTLTRNDTVIDLGAHVGEATVEFARRAGHVHAFEPNPANFDQLAANTARFGNVTIHRKAVSASTGTARLFFEDAKPGKFYEGATIVDGKSNVTYEKSVEVETISIIDVLKSIEGPVAFIKMDIEGAEYQVLETLIASGLMPKVGMVHYECHADRIPELVAEKARVLEMAKAAGVLQKLDLSWQ
jgi:FkbM family methyltransferase